jgi:hypothetical protein
VLPDSDWLARQLTSRNGKAFMRNISELPSGFETLDRMRHEQGGQRQVMQMIASADGAQAFERMTATPSARHARSRVRRRGASDDTSVPRIYTELEFLKRLKKSYEKEAAHRALTQPANDANSPDSKPGDEPAKEPYDPFKSPHG